MKINKLVIISLMTFGFLACSTEDHQKDQEIEIVSEISDITTEYILVSDSSSVKWERYLHEGPTKKKMKLFGADVEVEIGDVELNTVGEAQLNSGKLIEVNNELISSTLSFDMTTFKINTDMENKFDDLFKANEYPESILNFSQVVKTDSNYTLNGSLTIADVENSIVATANIFDHNEGKKMDGKFVINTLNWPLRDEEAIKSTIKDEVTVSISLFFTK